MRCTRIAEILGLLALRLRGSRVAESSAIADWIAQFVRAQPGTTHAVSDRYAVSLIPAVLTIAAADHDLARKMIHDTTVWLADAYEGDGLGLASVGAEPAEEIERLVGGALESVERQKRRGTSIATVLLDLAVAIKAPELYVDVVNDVRAVGACPTMLRLDHGPDQYSIEGMGNRLDPNVDSAVQLEVGAVAAPHHDDNAGAELVTRARSWDLLAVSSALRDRHFFNAIVACATYSTDATSHEPSDE